MKTPDNSIDFAPVTNEDAVFHQETPKQHLERMAKLDKKYTVETSPQARPEKETQHIEELRNDFRTSVEKPKQHTVEEKPKHVHHKYSQDDIDRAEWKTSEAKSELTRDGMFSPAGVAVFGTLATMYTVGSGLAGAALSAAAVDISAVMAGAPVASLFPAFFTTFAVVGPVVAVGYGGYKLFKYVQARRFENKLKRNSSHGTDKDFANA